MAYKGAILGTCKQGAEMLESESIQELFTLRRLGWGTKRIAKELGVSRNTVRDWLKTGSDRHYAGPARVSILADHLAWIHERFGRGVHNGDVLRQELAAERGVIASLRTVNRALKPLRRELALASKVTTRFETGPGCQMQVDFGEKWLEIGGIAQKRYLFVATLGFSRRGYVEVSPSQRQKDWLTGMEHAFQYFGGLPEELLVDNTKPLVLSHPPGHKATFNSEFLAFCAHWDLRQRACRSFRARTKGKVENGVGYVKGNALGDIQFEDDAHLERHLARWMREVADLRIHGTTFERPIDRFEKEKDMLRPVGNHPSYLRVRHEERTVASDFRVDLDTNRYSVPPQYVGEDVDVTVEADLIQVRWRGKVIAEHTLNPGRHQVVENPDHVLSCINGQGRLGKLPAIARSLAVYEDAVGGGKW